MARRCCARAAIRPNDHSTLLADRSRKRSHLSSPGCRPAPCGSCLGARTGSRGFAARAAALLGPPPSWHGSPDMERRRYVPAVTTYLAGLADRSPVLLVVDNLQYTGRSKVEFLHYLLGRQVSGSRLLTSGHRPGRARRRDRVRASAGGLPGGGGPAQRGGGRAARHPGRAGRAGRAHSAADTGPHLVRGGGAAGPPQG